MSRMFSGHHERVQRPDDVWQAVLTQFFFYVQALVKQLGDRFVNSKARGASQAYSGKQISGNADRLAPAFTTTAEDDRIYTSLSITPQDWPTAGVDSTHGTPV